jgi:hypothetical protein
MAGQKRALEDNPSRNVKKSKLVTDRLSDVPEKPVQFISNLMNEEVDFPRGGGTSLTAAEVKAIQAEATQEANEELFAVSSAVLLPIRLSRICCRHLGSLKKRRVDLTPKAKRVLCRRKM